MTLFPRIMRNTIANEFLTFLALASVLLLYMCDTRSSAPGSGHAWCSASAGNFTSRREMDPCRPCPSPSHSWLLSPEQLNVEKAWHPHSMVSHAFFFFICGGFTQTPWSRRSRDRIYSRFLVFFLFRFWANFKSFATNGSLLFFFQSSPFTDIIVSSRSRAYAHLNLDHLCIVVAAFAWLCVPVNCWMTV